jgi:hypothetical protein
MAGESVGSPSGGASARCVIGEHVPISGTAGNGIEWFVGSAIVSRPNGEEPPSSSGLGHLPFTQATRVRIPLGVLQGFTEVPWCSLECTPPCQGGGREFKSRRDRYTLTSPGVQVPDVVG